MKGLGAFLRTSLFLALLIRKASSSSVHREDRPLSSEIGGRRLQVETIIAGYVSVPVGADEVLGGASAIYSDNTAAATEIGTHIVSCPIVAGNDKGFDLFLTCLIYLYWHDPATGILGTTDTLMATGLSILTNATDTSEPVLQQFVITGGTGKYNGVKGWIDNDFTINPGKNTFTVSFYDEMSQSRTLEKEESFVPNRSVRRTTQASSLPSNQKSWDQNEDQQHDHHREMEEETITILCGFVSPGEGQEEVIRGTSPIYSDDTFSEEIGTFVLTCPPVSREGFAFFSPCLNYFYWHDATSGVGVPTDTLMMNGMSIITNVSDLTSINTFQEYDVLGGSGMYEGAAGWLEADFTSNPGYNTFKFHKGAQRRHLIMAEESLVVAIGEERRRLENGETVVTGFVGAQPEAVEILSGTDSIFGDGTTSPATGTFTLSCMPVGYPGFDVFDACRLYFNWHSVEEGILGTTDSLVANGVAIMTDLEDITKPFYRKFLILGGTGKYEGVTGWIESDFVSNPGFDTFTLRINGDDTATTDVNSTTTTTTISGANRLSSLLGVASLLAWSMVLFL
jgi:hypothetical protein